MCAEFSLVTTPRYDPELATVCERGLDYAGWNYTNKSAIYMLDYHHERILKAAQHFSWKPALEILQGPLSLESLSQQLLDFIGPKQVTPLRLRILVSPKGAFRFEKYDIPVIALENLLPERLPPPAASTATNDPRKTPEYILLIDQGRTTNSEHTYFKTTQRYMYDAARERARLTSKELTEVLIVNEADNSVMEGSLTTPYFWRNGKWVTPPVPRNFNQTNAGGQDGTTRRWALER